jgi:hypothetical protein
MDAKGNARSPYVQHNQKFTEISEEKSNRDDSMPLFHLPSITGSHVSYP